jgi:hypothetical protein
VTGQVETWRCECIELSGRLSENRHFDQSADRGADWRWPQMHKLYKIKRSNTADLIV